MTPEAYRAAEADAMTEAQLAANIAATATRLGWLRYHTHDSRRSPSGFPDEVLARGPRIIFAELKRQRGKLSTTQQAWRDRLELNADAVEANAVTLAAIRQRPGQPLNVGPPLVAYHLWRPSDWLDGTILTALT